jgi:putative ABC transport system permease protein
LGGRLQREVRALDPNVPITDLRPMSASLEGPAGFLMFHIGVWQAGAMGILGLVLALIGVYGVVSYGAAQRTREIGIRMALGATPRSVLGIILRQGVGLILAGLAAGLGGAFLMGRFFARVLINVSANDPLTLIATPLLLALVALCACYLPAHRAMRVSPMDALRHE